MEKKKNKVFNKDFTLVVIGQIISLFGNAILRFSLPLYLLRQTGSATIFGAVTATSFIPLVVLSVAGGILADRVNKRNIMVILDTITALLVLILYFTFKEISIVPLFITVLMFLYGISGVYQPAVQASIPLLIDRENLLRGNAIINQVNTLANLLGPVIGGMLFGASGLVPILVVGIVCFMLSAIMELFIKIPFNKRNNDKSVFAIVKDDLKDSMEFIRKDKPIFFSIGLIVAIFNLVLTSAIIVGIPILIIQILKMSDAKLGITQGVMALGGLLGGLIAAVWQKKIKLKNSHSLLGTCAFCVGVMGLVLFLNTSPFIAYVSITIMCFGIMGAATLFNIQIFTMIQSQTPPNLVGKVMATCIAVALSAQPIGQAIYGVLFDNFKDTSWIILFGTVLISICITVYSKKIFQNVIEESD